MKSFKVICLILCIILALGGCTPSSETGVLQPEEEQGEEYVAPDVVESGGSIDLSMRNPSTFNPLINSDVTVDRILSLIFEPLFILDSDQEVVGDLAESYTLSDDGKRMTIKLKQGQRWSDGYDLTARDVTYSLETIKNAPGDSMYKFVMANVSNYYTIDTYTLAIEYSEPFGGCEYNLCFPVIPRHYYRGKTDGTNLMPLGCGSYKVADYRKVRYITLVSDDNARDVPNIKKINVYIIPDNETDTNAFEHGITDAYVSDLEDLGRYESSENIQISPYNSNQFEFLGFNHNLPAFANKSVRQAIAFALPMDDIVNNIFVGRAVKSLTPVNPTSVLCAHTGVATYEYDPDLAQSMLESSGIDFSAQTFTIMVNSENTERSETAALMANALSAVGMNVTVESVDFETYRNRLESDNFQMFIGGIEFKDRVELSPLLSTSNGTTGTANYFNYSNSNMDALIDNCYYAVGQENYRKAINGLQSYFAEELPCIGIAFKSRILLTNSKIKGDKQPVIHYPYANIDKWYISGS